MRPVDPAAACLAALLALAACAAQAAPYAIDPGHTFVSWELLHRGLSTQRGRFLKSAGSLDWDRQSGRGRVEVTIDLASVDTGVAALDAWLRSDAFFDVARFPTAQFVAEHFVSEGERVSAVSGSLTLQGRSLPLTLRAARFNCYLHPFLHRETCGGEFEGSVRRADWGLGRSVDDSLADGVRLLVTVEAIKQ